MPTRDFRSNILPQQVMNASIVTNTTTSGSIIDTADYDQGVAFVFQTATWTDGTYTPNLLESDASNMAGSNSVAQENLIGTYAGAVISAATVPGATGLKTLGIFGTKRYIQVQEVSTGVTSGARIIVNQINLPEIVPNSAYATTGQ